MQNMRHEMVRDFFLWSPLCLALVFSGNKWRTVWQLCKQSFSMWRVFPACRGWGWRGTGWEKAPHPGPGYDMRWCRLLLTCRSITGMSDVSQTLFKKLVDFVSTFQRCRDASAATNTRALTPNNINCSCVTCWRPTHQISKLYYWTTTLITVFLAILCSSFHIPGKDGHLPSPSRITGPSLAWLDWVPSVR